MEALKARWDDLQPRERMLLMAMGGVFSLLGIFVISVLVSQGFDGRRREIDQYREALYTLEDSQATYAADKAEKEAMQETLENNDMPVSTFLSQQANNLSFDVNVSPKEAVRASSKDDSKAEEKEFEVTIKTVERKQLLDYLHTIDNSEAPLFVRKLNIRKASKGTATRLTASLTVVSFRIKQD